MSKLPKVFQNNNYKPSNNNKEYFYSAKEERSNIKNSKLSIEEELNEIFNGIRYPFSDTVIIKTDNKVYETNLIYRTTNNIITIDNDNIPISTINSLIIKK